jgi:IS5 family transposase
MRSNKIHTIDLFTQTASEHFEKHIKTQSKAALTLIDQKVNWNKLISPIQQNILP